MIRGEYVKILTNQNVLTMIFLNSIIQSFVCWVLSILIVIFTKSFETWWSFTYYVTQHALLATHQAGEVGCGDQAPPAHGEGGGVGEDRNQAATL